MSRQVRLLALLEAAGPAGVGQDRLADLAGYGGEPDARRQALTQDIWDLTEAGWDIDNEAGPGEKARYVLRARDTRLRIALSPRQQAELARVTRLAAIVEVNEVTGLAADPDDDTRLGDCVRATAARAPVTLHDGAGVRTIHPRAIRPGPSGWYLAGTEDGQATERYVAVDRISSVEVGRPGSAPDPGESRRGQADPAGWLVDPPEEVTVETTAEFVGEVMQALGPVMRRASRDGAVLLTFPVTHQAVFRTRLYPLGTRVRVVAPERVRASVVAELVQLADSS